MTPCDLNLWRYIATAIDASGIPPSYQEMLEATGRKSKSQIALSLLSLERQGVLRTDARRSRSITLLKQPPGESGLLCSIRVDQISARPTVWLSPRITRVELRKIRRALDHAESAIDAMTTQLGVAA